MPRIDDALSSLVSALLPALSDEDEQSSDERHIEGLALAKDVLQR